MKMRERFQNYSGLGLIREKKTIQSDSHYLIPVSARTMKPQGGRDSSMKEGSTKPWKQEKGRKGRRKNSERIAKQVDHGQKHVLP